MTGLPIYYLDTTIQLSKLFAPQSMRAAIRNRMAQHHCVVSRYVRMEYMRWLEPCVYLDRLKTLGDVMIALQTPADAVLWTTDAAYDVICPTLGFSHLRELIVAQTSYLSSVVHHIYPTFRARL
ncbi:MAG: hypothetical protein R3E79_53715 [Caldilineaceae bacterium]